MPLGLAAVAAAGLNSESAAELKVSVTGRAASGAFPARALSPASNGIACVVSVPMAGTCTDSTGNAYEPLCSVLAGVLGRAAGGSATGVLQLGEAAVAGEGTASLGARPEPGLPGAGVSICWTDGATIAIAGSVNCAGAKAGASGARAASSGKLGERAAASGSEAPGKAPRCCSGLGALPAAVGICTTEGALSGATCCANGADATGSD